MTEKIAGKEFYLSLRRALMHLYDPTELRRSPLLQWLGIENSSDRVGTLRRVIQDTIRQMNPNQHLQVGTTPRRLMDILTYRFIEQLTQKEVASDLAISLRQVQRLEAQALRSMAELLAAQYQLNIDWTDDGEGSEQAMQPPASQPQNSQLAQELEWLKQNYQPERIDLAAFIQSVIEKAEPVFKQQSIHLQLPSIDPPIAISGQATILCQALLSIFSRLAQSSFNNVWQINIHSDPHQVVVNIHMDKTVEAIPQDDPEIKIASQLLGICQAKFEWQISPKSISVLLELAQPRLVLVIDDNQDTLLLLERYLTGSNYQFVGTRQPEQAFSLIQKTQPSAIVLDVMLPEIDGWEFLSEIKRNPATKHIPIIVSTILPQQRLAMMLGADAFLQKPFTREKFLSTLDDLLAGLAIEP